ncbi:hypothetical protein L249_2226, partial [Ophiocordyceps polyrhachis-furcata BCC 54312]
SQSHLFLDITLSRGKGMDDDDGLKLGRETIPCKRNVPFHLSALHFTSYIHSIAPPSLLRLLPPTLQCVKPAHRCRVKLVFELSGQQQRFSLRRIFLASIVYR